MRIEQFKLANCSLFRQPTIDFSRIDIDTYIVEAWKSQYSPESAIGSILDNPEITRRLASQISTNLDYQREVELDNLKQAQDQYTEHYEGVRKGKADRVRGLYSGKISEAKKRALELNEEMAQKQDSYSAAQRQLDEMRARIEGNLKRIGGKKGFEKLMELHEAIASEAPYDSKEGKPTYDTFAERMKARKKRGEELKLGEQQESGLERALDLGVSTGETPSIEGLVTEAPREGLIRRFFKKIYSIFSYKSRYEK